MSSATPGTAGWPSSHYDDQAREIVRDLHNPLPRIFWTDFLCTSALAWSAFAAAVVLPPLSVGMLAAILVATLAFYRGLCFMHEIAHVRPASLPGFERAWNLLMGVPLLLPSFVYVGVHQDHHRISTYGTKLDPEYLPFTQSKLMPLSFAAHSVLIPAFLLLRFLFLSPLAMLLPRFHRLLAVHASSLSMNIAYRRAVNREVTGKMCRWELAILVFWGSAAALMARGALPSRTLAIWYSITALASLVNTLRTLAAHEYESSGEPLDRSGQLIDSIDTPGGIWTELWAPVGLRYHALHHYFPGIPYHNLSEAHSRLARELPPASPYHQTFSRGLFYSLRSLYQRAGRGRLQARSSTAGRGN